MRVDFITFELIKILLPRMYNNNAHHYTYSRTSEEFHLANHNNNRSIPYIRRRR